jgi:hypothetical protein
MRMQRVSVSRGSDNERRNFPLPAVAVALLLVSVLLGSCGVESYPYLFPAEAIAGEVGFSHDDRNDPNVFQGYELYYRLYDQASIYADGSVDVSQIKSDMQSYFNGSNDFFSVSFDDMGTTSISSSEDRGYRRFYVQGSKESVPLISISSGNVDSDFDAVIIDDTLTGNLDLQILGDSYSLRRNTTKSSSEDYPEFSNEGSDYELSDNDILSDQIEEIPSGGEKLVVAVFVVPYGFDSSNFTGIFANGTSDDMSYIGYFEYNL